MGLSSRARQGSIAAYNHLCSDFLSAKIFVDAFYLLRRLMIFKKITWPQHMRKYATVSLFRHVDFKKNNLFIKAFHAAAACFPKQFVIWQFSQAPELYFLPL